MQIIITTNLQYFGLAVPRQLPTDVDYAIKQYQEKCGIFRRLFWYSPGIRKLIAWRDKNFYASEASVVDLLNLLFSLTGSNQNTATYKVCRELLSKPSIYDAFNPAIYDVFKPTVYDSYYKMQAREVTSAVKYLFAAKIVTVENLKEITKGLRQAKISTQNNCTDVCGNTEMERAENISEALYRLNRSEILSQANFDLIILHATVFLHKDMLVLLQRLPRHLLNQKVFDNIIQKCSDNEPEQAREEIFVYICHLIMSAKAELKIPLLSFSPIPDEKQDQENPNFNQQPDCLLTTPQERCLQPAQSSKLSRVSEDVDTELSNSTTKTLIMISQAQHPALQIENSKNPTANQFVKQLEQDKETLMDYYRQSVKCLWEYFREVLTFDKVNAAIETNGKMDKVDEYAFKAQKQLLSQELKRKSRLRSMYYHPDKLKHIDALQLSQSFHDTVDWVQSRFDKMLLALLTISDEHRHEIEDEYAEKLAELSASQEEIKILDEELKNQREQDARVREEIREREASIRESIREQEATIREQEATIREQEATIREQEASLRELQNEGEDVQNLRQQLQILEDWQNALLILANTLQNTGGKSTEDGRDLFGNSRKYGAC